MTKNTKNSHSDVTIIYHLRRRPLLPIRWKNAPGVDSFLENIIRKQAENILLLLSVSLSSSDAYPFLNHKGTINVPIFLAAGARLLRSQKSIGFSMSNNAQKYRKYSFHKGCSICQCTMQRIPKMEIRCKSTTF